MVRRHSGTRDPYLEAVERPSLTPGLASLARVWHRDKPWAAWWPTRLDHARESLGGDPDHRVGYCMMHEYPTPLDPDNGARLVRLIQRRLDGTEYDPRRGY